MIKFNANQIKAIKKRNCFTVVSASAGSGKTAVIVERVLDLINGKNSLNIDELLIVTFTVKAAEELRNRISSQIFKKLSENSFDKNLLKQKFLFNFAHIETIDSFCNKILKENFEKCNIKRNFKIASEKEIFFIEKEAIDTVINKIYSKELLNNSFKQKTEIINTIEFFVNEKDDEKMSDIILKLYRSTKSFRNFNIFFDISKKICEEVLNLNNDSKEFLSFFLKTKIGVFFRKIIDTKLNIITIFLKKSLNWAESDEKIKKSYFESINKDLENVEKLKINLNKENFFNFSFSHLGRLPNFDSLTKQKIIFARKEAKKVFNDLLEYFYSFGKTSKDIKKMLSLNNNIFEIFNLFVKELKTLKYKKNIIDFTDLERLALKIFKKNNTSNDIIKTFKEIIVDEYQDVNYIQDEIFGLISENRKKMFIVGDPKQSIYGFRRTSPEIFVNHLKSCAEKINFNENFRSENEILKKVNYFFKYLMTENTSGINYKENHKILSNINHSTHCVQFNMINFSECEETNIENYKYIIEAKFIANFIVKAVNNKEKIFKNNIEQEIQYSDFCILLRNANKKAHNYIEIFKENLIPVSTSQFVSNFFEKEEIKNILSFLQVINNPLRDIDLTCLLISPIFKFTFEEILKIRQNYNEDFLYFELEKASKDNLENISKKCGFFLLKIKNYRKCSKVVSLEELVNLIIDDYFMITKNFFDHEKKINIIKQFSFIIKEYRETNRCLAGFVEYLKKIKDNEISMNFDNENSSENCVKIMSIHKSKGLEFPICILAGCFNKFLNEYEEIITNLKFGLGIKLKSEDDTTSFQNIIRKLCETDLKNEKISEEIRLLYVAMTRPKEKLIVMVTEKNLRKKIENVIFNYNFHKKINEEIILDLYFKNCKNFSDWIIYLIIKIIDPIDYIDFIKKVNMNKNDEIKVFDSQINKEYFENIDFKENNASVCYDNHIFLDTENSLEFIKKINNRLNFTYKNKNKFPLKISASQINFKNRSEIFSKYSCDFDINSRQINSSMHNLFILSDFNILLKNYDVYLNSLFLKKYLTKMEFKILSQNFCKNHVLNFLLSTPGKRLIKSNNIFKKYQFSILEKINDDNNKIFIQGSIDFVFEEEGEFVIIDYKTEKIFNLKKSIVNQLNKLKIYKKAFEKCELVKVKEIIVYSSYLNDYIIVDENSLNY